MGAARRPKVCPSPRQRQGTLRFLSAARMRWSISLLLALCAVLLYLPPASRAYECDRMFISNPDGPKNGSFSAPHMENPLGHSRQCIYTFIAQENERVDINFTRFRVRGSSPDCSREYVDLYTELADPSSDLISTPFGGRYCGRVFPRRRISMHRTLVIGFYTDYENDTADVFHGTYQFVDASRFLIGKPEPGSVCSFTIYGDQKREGDFFSPTYPGVYPKNLQCRYRFLGSRGQRVRLEFLDFDLFYGGSHCPFDYVKIYDGNSSEDTLIGTYCGQQRNLVVYSSASNLYVKFTTLRRMADSQNRGFAGWFEFGEKFVNLDFIKKNDGEHIRGTECDQKILSRKESNGTVYSPNWPLPYQANIVCRYYIYGMEDAQHLERVRLDFDKFHMDDHRTDDGPECTDAYLKLYMQGQEERQAVDEFDHAFCGNQAPPALISEGPRLVMVFSSGQTKGTGFRARYSFETDYKVPGTPSPNNTCHFWYLSESQATGDFNSPRYPANYPSSTRCEYIFLGGLGEQVKIVFNYFKTKAELAYHGYNEACVEDWLEIYEVSAKGESSKIGRYCAKTAPGPIVSDTGVNMMKVILHTDSSGVASGFSATYYFLKDVNKFGDCGGNITGEENGLITSPGYPNPYKNDRQMCNWYITVRPGHKVFLHFTLFLIEGHPGERGCPSAVVRVWKNLSDAPLELCGEGLTNDTREVISTSNVLKVSFMTAQKAVGNGGFRAVWTEIREDPTCEDLRCTLTGYCISSRLRCNDLPNCGSSDNTDEDDCVRSPELNLYLVGGVSGGCAAFTLLTLCLVCRSRRRRRRRRRRHPPFGDRPPLRPPPPGEVPAMHFVSMDTV
ncbi:cubilin-like isoform X1 [Dermacentor albipictus]|uniref:cubilin-like isoform X1 n=2 Tax=Dermacentor albipictus TaxID=60249 RepID=UPI0031FDF095